MLNHAGESSMTVYAVRHSLGVSLVKATTPQAALKRIEKQFGGHGAPYRLERDQEEAIAWAQAMGAGVLE